ncbi:MULTISPECIES: allophanate hydrolase [Rhodomicrobium]|uniref:allophanate hydrolase n=1 Tax=Rhodomicrobium TaxID=1068 RepID=UPI000B4C0D08|nr:MULTISPECIES: allophanate hydrolase [Rhodomicrobium]
MTETATDLAAAHRSGSLSPRDTIRRSFARLEAAADPAIFITLRDEADLVAEAEALGDGRDLPLYGVPVAVKDNIDVAGLPTTAACPGFSYLPDKDATAVARLRAAGALIIGKTNLDQFATGLVGARSPYGVPRNALRADLIPGGSSSGSAVAVARGIVPLALGTDTAGSGRVPAGLNNIAGLKPSLGLMPGSGVVPACRSLDCISIFALTAADAFGALQVMAGFDAADAYSRALPLGVMGAIPPGLRVGIPRAQDLYFFGDADAEGSFRAGVERLRIMGASLAEIDLTPFFDAAALLYHGPWVAERTAAVWDFIEAHPDTVHPITKAIIGQGAAKSAVETFRAIYSLREIAREAGQTFRDIDALMVPTIPGPVTLAELEAEPVGLNTRLGTYTNFVNLLDMAGFAVPASIGADGRAHGVTFLAPAGRDAELASLASVFHAQTGLPLGALGIQPEPLPSPSAGLRAGEVAVAVVGAHLSGLPLNHELKDLGARFLEEAATAEIYRLFALETRPEKPGLIRVPHGGGASIALELWALSFENFGRFVASVPSPMAIGTISLADGRQVKGFLAETEAVANAEDITHFGGWRAFLASLAHAG